MPHLFIPLRQRKYALGLQQQQQHSIIGVLSSDNFWEDFNVWVYLVGGIMFVIGSFYFLPRYDHFEPVGCWLFIIASIFWLIVSLHDAAELAVFHKHLLIHPNVDSAACLNYIVGSILFIMGSIFYLPSSGRYLAGALCFITGSILFVVGAILNGLQIFEAKTKRDAQYMLMTAMFYVIGSVMFLVGSIPYLYNYQSSEVESKVDTFLASVYITGSIFFAIGGVVNFHRSRIGQKLRREILHQPLLEGESEQQDISQTFVD